MMEPRPTPVLLIRQFAFVAVPVVLVLGVLNALPRLLGGDPPSVLRYATVEEAEARLGVRLYRPAPAVRAWRWPPDRVRFAARGPGWVEFDLPSRAAGSASRFVLCQTIARTAGASQAEPQGADMPSADRQVPAALLSPGQVLQENDVSIEGRAVHVQRLLLDDGRIVHELWWHDGTRRVMLRAAIPADILLRMAPALVEK